MSYDKHIYLMRDGSRFKIGVATDAQRRRRDLQTGNSNPVRLHYATKVRDAHKLESSLHTIFSRRHISGEWFALSFTDRVLLRMIVALYKHGGNAIADVAVGAFVVGALVMALYVAV